MSTNGMSLANCTTCGAGILWAKRVDNGRWNKPLDALSGQTGYILVGEEITVGTLYQAHTCKTNDANALLNEKRLQDAMQAEHETLNLQTVHPDKLHKEAAEDDPQLVKMKELDAEAKGKFPAAKEEFMKKYNWPLTWYEFRYHYEKTKRRAIEKFTAHAEVAMKRRCPYCLVKREELCVSVIELRKGNRVVTKVPHPERQDGYDKTLHRPAIDPNLLKNAK